MNKQKSRLFHWDCSLTAQETPYFYLNPSPASTSALSYFQYFKHFTFIYEIRQTLRYYYLSFRLLAVFRSGQDFVKDAHPHDGRSPSAVPKTHADEIQPITDRDVRDTVTEIAHMACLRAAPAHPILRNNFPFKKVRSRGILHLLPEEKKFGVRKEQLRVQRCLNTITYILSANLN